MAADKQKYTVSDNTYLDFSKDGFGEGDNTVNVNVKGYEDISFKVTLDENGGIAGEDGPAPSDKLTPPDVKKAELKTSVLGGKYYRVSFKNLTEEELAAYLTILKKEDKTEIQVNGRTYEYSSWSISSNDEDKYKVSEDESFGGLKYLDFSINGFNTEEENTVTIEAEGYDELSFAVYTDENGRVTEREEPDNNGAAAVPSENVSTPAKEPEPDVTVDKTEDSGNKAEPDNKEPEESDKEMCIRDRFYTGCRIS